MNYYNPYFYTMPGFINTANATTRTGLFSRLFGGMSFGRIISGTERALNFANQAIPLVKQIKPMIGNAKTMFKVMNEFKKQEKPMNYSANEKYNNVVHQNANNTSNEIKKEINNNEPTFFM